MLLEVASKRRNPSGRNAWRNGRSRNRAQPKLTCKRTREAFNVGSPHAQAMIGHRHGTCQGGFDCVQTIHFRFSALDAALSREFSRVADGSGPACEKI